jgi:hypothetical protein
VPYLFLVDLPKNKGKGFCIKMGFKYAKGEYALMYDADMAVPIYTLEQWLQEPCPLNCIMIGSRNTEEEGVIRRFNPVRRLVSLVFQQVSQWVVPYVQDTQCGFKLFPKSIYSVLVSVQQ